MRNPVAFASLGGVWLFAAAFAPPDLPRLDYDLAGLTPDAQAVEPGEQYPPTQRDRATSPVGAASIPAAAAGRRGAEFKLTVDASIVADSNVTNATDLNAITVNSGGVPVAVPLDPSLRARGDAGLGLSATAAMRVPLSDRINLAVDAESYLLDYGGKRTDDASVLIAAGAEERVGSSTSASLQLLGFQRWYGGIAASQGFGARARIRTRAGEGGNVSLSLDARSYESDYGDDFGGDSASVYLSYDRVLDPATSAMVGVYGRREWLGLDSFSSVEIGAYGGLSHYFGDHFSGGVSAGLSRVAFDAPIVSLSPDPREDWRFYASLYLTTRRPIAWGFHPSLTYTWNRIDSSIDYYTSDRHRLRFGLSRTF